MVDILAVHVICSILKEREMEWDGVRWSEMNKSVAGLFFRTVLKELIKSKNQIQADPQYLQCVRSVIFPEF